MIYYYFFAVCLAIALLMVKRFPLWIFSAVLVYFIVVFVDDGFIPPDYENYLQVFENAFRVEGWPYYKTITFASVEELYVTFNGFVKFNIADDFVTFMMVNAALSLLLYYLLVRKMLVHHRAVSFVMLLPVIYPTGNYFLLRSSLPFFLGLLALAYLANKKWWPAVVLFVIGFNIHNQYILSFFLTVVAFFYLKRGIAREDFKTVNRVLLISAVILAVFLGFANVFQDLIAQAFSFLPNSNLTSTKINYLETERQSYRYTAVLSIGVFPYFCYKILKHKLNYREWRVFYQDNNKDLMFVYLLFALSLAGAAINIGFIDNSHVAGRLSRFSDYVLTLFILHTYFKLYTPRETYKLIILFIVLISPLIYPAVYMDIEWDTIF